MKIVQVIITNFIGERTREGAHGGYYQYEFALTDSIVSSSPTVDRVDFGYGRKEYSTLKNELRVLTEIE